MKPKVIILFVCSIVVIAASLLIVKADIWLAVKTIFTGSLGDANKISGTIKEMTPLLILGSAVYLALKAGLSDLVGRRR